MKVKDITKYLERYPMLTYYATSLLPGSAFGYILFNTFLGLPMSISYILGSFFGATIYLPFNMIIFRKKAIFDKKE